ncbi:hypothetical protein COV19_01790 [Candidatus Woesearchaeota archaeon CG10_big_fil_rev_8_21_14_0_10_44_13]|nr:MAG: hypothetical protein COV19_01790 [Candidatus Woesearchaeota archaeon CG10_big_fil_rev_8_21_14_0_10_44_13]
MKIKDIPLDDGLGGGRGGRKRVEKIIIKKYSAVNLPDFLRFFGILSVLHARFRKPSCFFWQRLIKTKDFVFL